MQYKLNQIIFFRKMARKISPVCNFIFGSICTGLLTDTVDVELTIRTVKGIYMYRKDHMAKSTVFSPWSRTIILFPLYARRSKHSRMTTGRCQHGTKAILHLTFPPKPKPNIDIPQGRPGLDGLTRGIDLNPIKTEWYNMQDRHTIHFNKIDIIKPNPK